MSPVDIILDKAIFTDKEEFKSLKEKASSIYNDFPFLAASYIYKNSTNKQLKESKIQKDNQGLDIFSILASAEISQYSANASDDSEEVIGFLRNLIDAKWNFKEAEAAEKKTPKLNKPFRTPKGPKKFAVYVRNEQGNVVIVRFGDPEMEIKRDDPERRKNFRARHGCDNPGPKWKAKYWSCKMWSGKSVSDITSGEIDWDNLPEGE